MSKSLFVKKKQDNPAYYSNSPIFASLDLGTNNCRLLIAQPTSEKHIKVLDTFSKIVRLGEGLSVDNRLTAEAMNRTVEALLTCKRKMDKFDIKSYRFIATEACRKAENTQEFLELVHKRVGIDIEVISNEEEAKLAFLGCSTLLSCNIENALVFDIGGGSTEFMWVKKDNLIQSELLGEHKIIDWLSLDQGVMNLSEKFGGTAFTEMYFDELVGYLVKKLREFDKQNKISEFVAKNRVQMLSTSGTLTTLAAIHLKLSHYERSKIDGTAFSTNDLREATAEILAMSPLERFSNTCIGADRSDYIISGCAIFEAICTLWNIPQVTIADRGVREGITISLMQEYVKSLC